MNSNRNEIEQMLANIKLSNSNKTLFDHFTKLYETRELINDDRKFLDIIEDVSLKLKQNDTYLVDVNKHQSLIYYLEEFNKNAAARFKLSSKLMKEREDNQDDDQPAEEFGPVDFVPDYLDVFRQLEWMGVSFGEKEGYLLTNSIRNLCAEKGMTSGLTVKFWGKMYGRQQDYYIVEADAEPGEADELKPSAEVRGSGINVKKYYVTSDLVEGKWIELPDTNNELLVQARKINYMLKGNLEADIISNPHFAGKEKDYLRCQIARITYGCQLVPSGLFKQVPDERNIQPEDTPKKLGAKDLANLANWHHVLPNILKEGRLTHYEGNINPDLDADQQEEEKARILKNDPFADILASAKNDTKLKSSIPNYNIEAWKVGVFYDDKVYTNKELEVQLDDENNVVKDNKFNYSLVAVKSNRWVGAFNYAIDGDYNFMYVGWGSKFNDSLLEKRFLFEDFPIIQSDVQEAETVPEPHLIAEEVEPVDDNKSANDD